MIIDAHQHFWRYSPEAYPWIGEPLRAIRRDYSPATLAPFLATLGIHGTVAVEARMHVSETTELLALARAHPFIKGVVGWIPLSDPRVGAVLDELATDPKLKGVRHVAQGEPPGFLDAAAFNAGLREATARGLNFDICIYARQLPEATRLIDRHPRQVFVLDHIAKPVVQGPPPAEWCRQIGELARRPQVTCKFSGVVTEVPGWQWTPAALQPYFDVVLAAFGPSRLMFGSDWPVCLVASEYERWFRFVEACAAPLSAAERVRVLGGTAVAVYRL